MNGAHKMTVDRKKFLKVLMRTGSLIETGEAFGFSRQRAGFIARSMGITFDKKRVLPIKIIVDKRNGKA